MARMGVSRLLHAEWCAVSTVGTAWEVGSVTEGMPPSLTATQPDDLSLIAGVHMVE